MSWVLQRPSLTLLELAWHWVFGIPFIAVCWFEAQQILSILPAESSGLTSIDLENPWVAAVQIADAWSLYRPHVLSVLGWLAPASALAWVVISGLGRGLVLKRLDASLPFRAVEMILLQIVWLAALGANGWAWWRSMQWAAASHIRPGAEPDLVGYAIWAIFLSLGFFTLWSLVSWVLSIAPLLALLEDCDPATALLRSLRLQPEFKSKLVETNMVMGIVRLALIVLAMVFSAAPLPFRDELGPDAMHVVFVLSTIFYLVASDYFQVVRLKGFVEFWKMFRAAPADAS
jgi:hypothetical protein